MYPPDCILAHNPARPCRPKGGFGLVMMMMMMTMVQVHGPRLHKPDLSKLQEQLTCLHVYMKSNIKVR